MKIAISVLAVALLAVVLLLATRSNDGQGTGQETVPAQSEPASPVLDSNNPAPPRERPQFPPRSTPERKVEQSVPVQIDRRPFDPTMETDSQYERRANLIVAFDRFCEESGISDKKAQAVLDLLYDWQETVRHLRKQHLDRILDDSYRDEWEEEYKSRETSHAWLLILMDTHDALEEMLTPEEMRAWNRTLEKVEVWGVLHWPYEPPLIIPAE